MAKRRFKSKAKAESFANVVNGKLKDLRGFPESISDYVVIYTPKKGGGRKGTERMFGESFPPKKFWN